MIERREAHKAQFPWIDPTVGYPNDTLIPGVREVKRLHCAVRGGASHKSIVFVDIVHSKGLEHVDGFDWELFTISKVGEIAGKKYYWGMFVEGIGAINVMVPAEYCRPLSQVEKEAWSQVTLSMYGSHTGSYSYSLPSGVSANEPDVLP